MRIVDQGVAIPSRKGTSRQSCAFPGLCVLPSGRWLCSCRAAPTKSCDTTQTALLAWSDDQGSTWSRPRAPFRPPPVDKRPGLIRAAYLTPLGGKRVLAALAWVEQTDEGRPFFNTKTQGLLDMRILLSESKDAGETWDAPRLVDTYPFLMPTPLTGPILPLHDGAWACQYELNKSYYDTAEWRHASVFLFTSDRGRTWPRHSTPARDPAVRYFYWDQRPAVFPDGRILDLFWTYDNRAGVYLNIHASESLDNGRTWSDRWDTGVPGQPAPPVSLPDGRLAMVYVDRTAEPTIKARCSSDGGRTWPRGTELCIYRPPLRTQTVSKKSMQDAWAEMGKFSVGLPTTAPLPGGAFLVCYYAGPETDRTDIRWAKIGT